MANFKDKLTLRTVKGSPINETEHDSNFDTIGSQFDLFKVLTGTTAPTASNTPVGESGNVIVGSDSKLYIHNGTVWVGFTGLAVADPKLFLSFTDDQGGLDNSLHWTTDLTVEANNPSGHYVVYDITDSQNPLNIGSTIPFDPNGGTYDSGQSGGVMTSNNIYKIQAWDGVTLLTDTESDGFPNIQMK